MSDPTDSEIHWRDMAGRVHQCDSGAVEPDMLFVWTRCKFDVPDNEAYIVERSVEPVTCPLCLSGETLGQPGRERIGVLPNFRA